MILVADYTFFKDLAGGDIQMALREMLLLVDEVDFLFRLTDFDNDGTPDNIGFYVKFIIIHKIEQTSLENENTSATSYLKKLSQIWHMNNHACLTIGFTHKTFNDTTLGASWINFVDDEPPGGICQSPVYMFNDDNRIKIFYLNTLFVSSRLISADVVPIPMAVTNMLHELGHSFGSEHDSVEVGQPCYYESSFVMVSYSLWGDEKTNFMFSNCSKLKMAEIIKRKGSCLESPLGSNGTFCGNGRICFLFYNL